MRKSVTESTVLFLSIIKWVSLATVAGAVVGLAVSLFLKSLTWGIALTSPHSYFFWLLPVSLFLSSLMIKYIAPDAKGHGTEKVIEAVHRRAGRIPLLVVPVKAAATLVTLALGGSVGKEGPCAQIGAGLTSLFSDIFRFDDHDRKKMVICGISAGFASVFGTPIAGSIFGVEVLFVGAIMYDVLLPSFVAGITSYQVSSWLGVAYFHEPINVVPVFTELFAAKVLLAGVFFGLCSIILIASLHWGERLSNRIRVWAPLKGAIGGVLLVGLTYVFSDRYLGLGLDSVQSSLRGNGTDWYAFLIKPIFTSLTLNFGGSGGIVTIIFFEGATAGVTFAHLLQMDPSTLAAIGIVAVLAGSANTPIAASIMSVELFGPAIAPYATLACVVSFLMTGHRSVYPSQVLSISKSPSLQVDLGREIEEIQATLNLRKKGFISRIFRLIKRIEDKVGKIEHGATSRKSPKNDVRPDDEK